MGHDDLVLGFDIGTSAVKGALYDMRGVCIFETTIAYQHNMPCPDWLEQDPEDWIRCMRDIAVQVGNSVGMQRLIGIGICSQVNTHVFVDESGNPLRGAIVWQDQRCASVAEELRHRAMQSTATANIPVDASSLLSRAEWVCRFEPQVWKRTRWILSPKDYCILVLTGCPVTDPMTSIGLVNMEGEYIGEAIALVADLERRLPPIRPLAQYAGRTGVDWLPSDVPVAVGTMDAWASLFGSGIRAAGDAFQVAGTSEVIGILSSRGEGVPGIVTFPRFNGLYLHAGPTQAGGDALKWFAQAIGRDMDNVLALATSPAAADEPLVFLPHLMGERAPLWDSVARGVFIGLSKRHKISDMALAVLRGVAMSARHLLEEVERSAATGCTELRISGGASRSDLWCQIKADVMNRTLRRVQNRDSGAFGAALLAREGVRRSAGIDDSNEAPIRIERTFEPDRDLAGFYQELYVAYRSAYEGLKPAFAALARLRSA